MSILSVFEKVYMIYQRRARVLNLPLMSFINNCFKVSILAGLGEVSFKPSYPSSQFLCCCNAKIRILKAFTPVFLRPQLLLYRMNRQACVLAKFINRNQLMRQLGEVNFNLFDYIPPPSFTFARHNLNVLRINTNSFHFNYSFNTLSILYPCLQYESAITNLLHFLKGNNNS